jgi:hypothetical protein
MLNAPQQLVFSKEADATAEFRPDGLLLATEVAKLLSKPCCGSVREAAHEPRVTCRHSSQRANCKLGWKTLIRKNRNPAQHLVQAAVAGAAVAAAAAA